MSQQNKTEIDPHEDLNDDPVPKFKFDPNITVCYGGGLCSVLPLRTTKIDVDELRKSFKDKYYASYI